MASTRRDPLVDAVQMFVDDAAQRQGIQTLGEVRGALAALPSATPVVIEGGATPADLHSYRGYYERLSIGTDRGPDYKTEAWRHMAHPEYDPEPNLQAVRIAEPVTVGEMIAALDLADGETFGGYKGGGFTMGSHTYMHVADHGDCGLAVVGVSVIDGVAVIHTAEDEW